MTTDFKPEAEMQWKLHMSSELYKSS